MGIDPARQCGWSLLDDNKIEEFGQVICPATFTLPQSLNYYHREFTTLFERLKPDYCSIEDVLLAISGVKVLVKLARINGVVIQSAFMTMKDRVQVYYPTFWKANSLPGLNGSSPKWKIQFEVVKHFNLVDKLACDIWENQITEAFNEILEKKVKWEILRDEINKLKNSLVRKRNPLDENEKLENENKIKILTNQLAQAKAEHKAKEKENNKHLMSIGNEICSQTGISSDIADSICIAICAQRKINSNG
jgi:Holliday junction resolvasome RuvABC endonuclease subunit